MQSAMAEMVGGALLGPPLNALIELARRAYRCKGVCEDLVATLESLQTHLGRIPKSSMHGHMSCEAWVKSLQSLLEEAEGIVKNCVKGSRYALIKKIFLYSKIRDVDRRIREKISSEGILVLAGILQGIDHKVTPSPVTNHPPEFEMQEVPPHVVAFDNNPFERLKELILLEPCDGAKSIGIKGGGGVGKSLLAKMLNNDVEIQQKYGDGKSILWITIGQDISVASVYQRMGKFLNDEVFGREICKRRLEEQRKHLMDAFKGKSVLLILDDIWEKSEEGCAMIHWLDICKGVGSTTVITTRDKRVLDHVRVKERIEVKPLSEEASWKLFSFHAFQPDGPPSHEIIAIAKAICNECKGLPLALKVIGGALWDTKDERGWKYALSRLKGSESLTLLSSVEDELFCRLKYSYDVLDDETKKCFLYFAAFPEDFNIPTEDLCSIWQAEGLFGSRDVDDALNTGWMNLVTLADRSLIDLDGDGKHAKVHDVMRDLAIRIIRDASFGEWAHECQFEPGKVFETLPKIKETTKRVSFIGSHVKNIDPQMCRSNYNLQVCLLSYLTFDYGSGFPIGLPRDFFSRMTHLLYLSLEACSWLEEIPESIKELKSLTYLVLSGCKSLKELPESIKELKSLTHLVLSWCSSLKELPENVKELKSLTHLDLYGCSSLKELSESIKELKSLTHLDLYGCMLLKELPESIEELKSLMYLDLRRCRSLKELPESIKELKSLMHLYLCWCTSLKKLPESIKELKSLTHLDLIGCSSLMVLPESIKELKSLSHLFLRGCTSLKELPENIKELKSLTHLDLTGFLSLKVFPESIKELKSLSHLFLRGCTSLKELPESINELKSLTHLVLSRCTSLKELPKSIKLKSLTHLYLSGCKSLKELPESIKEFKSLTHLDLSGCTSLKELPESIKELKSLKHLVLIGCTSLKELPESIKELNSLTHLDLRGCLSLKELPESIKELKSLWH